MATVKICAMHGGTNHIEILVLGKWLGEFVQFCWVPWLILHDAKNTLQDFLSKYYSFLLLLVGLHPDDHVIQV